MKVIDLKNSKISLMSKIGLRLKLAIIVFSIEEVTNLTKVLMFKMIIKIIKKTRNKIQ